MCHSDLEPTQSATTPNPHRAGVRLRSLAIAGLGSLIVSAPLAAAAQGAQPDQGQMEQEAAEQEQREFEQQELEQQELEPHELEQQRQQEEQQRQQQEQQRQQQEQQRQQQERQRQQEEQQRQMQQEQRLQQQPGQQQQGQQGAQQQGQFETQSAEQAQGQQQAQDLAVSGQVRGVVREVNLQEGQLTMAAGGESVTLQAKPTQIIGLRPGEQFVASYANYGGNLWLMENLDQGDVAQFGRSANAVGTVEKVNKVNGQLTLATAGGSRTFRAHPQDVQDLLPGQYISLSFQRIGGNQWISSIQQAQGGGQ